MKYEAIKAWGFLLKSDSAWIEAQQAIAKKQKAPILAIYQTDGKWETLDKVTNWATRQKFRNNWPELAKQAWGDE